MNKNSVFYLIFILFAINSVECSTLDAAINNQYKIQIGSETASGNWDNFYSIQFPFSVGDRVFLYGQNEKTKKFFIQELLPGGRMGTEKASWCWNRFYRVQFHYSIDGRHFVYRQSEEGNYWVINELKANGEMGDQTDGGSWTEFYDVQFPFSIRGRQYFFGQNANVKDWFIRELKSDGKMGDNSAKGTWTDFYPVQFPFTVGNQQFFYGQREKDNFWFIQELSSDGKLGSGTDNGYWNNFYRVQFPISIGGIQYLYGQAEERSHYFIQQILSDGTVGKENTDGYLFEFYPVQFTFTVHGRQFVYRHSINDNRWFVHEISACKRGRTLGERHFSDYKFGCWNMQGASDGESKWRNIVGRIMSNPDNDDNLDIMALQECGAIPNSAIPHTTPSDSTPIAENAANNIVVNQRLWSLGTSGRSNDLNIYHVTNIRSNNRVSMAIVSRQRADEILIVGPVGLATRPVLGIRIGNDYFFNIHAGAHQNNEAPAAIRAVENHMSGVIQNELDTNNYTDASYVIMGDYNRPPSELQGLDRPANIHRDFAIPGTDTHHGTGRSRILDYAITGTGTQSDRRLVPTTSGNTLSDHIMVLFLTSQIINQCNN